MVSPREEGFLSVVRNAISNEINGIGDLQT